MRDGLSIHRLPFATGSVKQYTRTRRGQLLLMPRLAGFLWRRRKSFDIVHVHGALFPLVWPSLFMSRVLGKRMTATIWSPDDDVPSALEGRRLGALQLRILARVDRLVAVTSFILDDCRRAGFSPERLRRIPAGIDSGNRFTPVGDGEKAALRRGLSLDPRAPVAVYTGGIIHRKGIDLLVEAWRRVAERFPEALLLLVGPADISEGPARSGFAAEMRQKIAGYGLQERVRFVGQVDDVERYLQLADLFVFPSRRETFGISLIEGMACGLPSVVSTIEGVSTDIVEDGVDGVLLPPGDADEIARAVIRLWSDPPLARRLGEQARRKVESTFTIDIAGRQHMAMYEELLARP